MKKQGITPLKKLIEEIGGWPVVLGDIWDEKTSTWEEVIYEAFKRGLTIGFPFQFTTARLSSTNATHYKQVYGVKIIFKVRILKLSSFLNNFQLNSPASLPITNDCYHQLDSCNYTYDLYETYQIETAILFGADKERAEKDMANLIKFETLLSNVRKSVKIF